MLSLMSSFIMLFMIIIFILTVSIIIAWRRMDQQYKLQVEIYKKIATIEGLKYQLAN